MSRNQRKKKWTMSMTNMRKKIKKSRKKKTREKNHKYRKKVRGKWKMMSMKRKKNLQK